MSPCSSNSDACIYAEVRLQVHAVIQAIVNILIAWNVSNLAPLCQKGQDSVDEQRRVYDIKQVVIE